MKLQTLLSSLFPAGHTITSEGPVFSGRGMSESGPVEIVGTQNGVSIGVQEILFLSRAFIRVMRESPGRPILMLADDGGQKMALLDEQLGLNQYIGHLVQLEDIARRRGHPVVALVYGGSVAGGFIAFGLCAGHTYALPESQTAVMRLPAMARVTKVPIEELEKLSRTLPVFAPGVENFNLTGGIREIWTNNLNHCLEQALKRDQYSDERADLGLERGGRTAASSIIRTVVNESA